MRKLWLLVLFIFFAGSAQASNMTRDLMSDDVFQRLMPRQGPLIELFTSIVHAPPVPILRTQNKPVRIAVLLSDGADTLANEALLLSFKQRMRELNIDYRLDVYIDNLEYAGDVSNYLKIEKSAPDYIVMTKLGMAQRRFLERFLYGQQTKVLLYDFSTPLTQWLDRSPLMYTGFDQRQTAKRLASYLDRQLPVQAKLSALVLPDGYLGHMRCDAFLDEITRLGRVFHTIDVVQNTKEQATELTKRLLDEGEVDFVFSCASHISEGVLVALEEANNSKVQTNGWGLTHKGIEGLTNPRIKVSVLFMKDYLSVALAEAIKLDLEGKNMPSLYIARSTLVPSELDFDSLRLMAGQAYPYSVMLWQK